MYLLEVIYTIMIHDVKNLVNGSSFVSPALGAAGQGRLNINNKFPPKKIWAKPKQAGKKEEGLGEGIFARLPKRSPAACSVRAEPRKKVFVSF